MISVHPCQAYSHATPIWPGTIAKADYCFPCCTGGHIITRYGRIYACSGRRTSMTTLKIMLGFQRFNPIRKIKTGITSTRIPPQRCVLYINRSHRHAAPHCTPIHDGTTCRNHTMLPVPLHHVWPHARTSTTRHHAGILQDPYTKMKCCASMPALHALTSTLQEPKPDTGISRICHGSGTCTCHIPCIHNATSAYIVLQIPIMPIRARPPRQDAAGLPRPNHARTSWQGTCRYNSPT